MNSSAMLKRPSAFLPVAMSFGALGTVLIFVALHGTAPQADEGTAAHIWQLLMASPGTDRNVLRDQVGAAITKTCCAHPRPASRRCTGCNGARLLLPLVGVAQLG